MFDPEMIDPKLLKAMDETAHAMLEWIGFGTLVGLTAKAIMPGRDPGGFLVTVLIGIGGGLVGGFLGRSLGVGAVTGFNLVTILTATGGAVLLLAVYRGLKR
mgnify:CR=1 FL=1